MLGAGKGTVANYLTKNKNFVYLSVRNFLAAEVLRHGKMVSRQSISQAANELKSQFGQEYIVKELLTQALLEKKRPVVIESIRTKEEAQYLKTHGVKLWAIDTDPKLRYVRLMDGKKDADKISFEQFLAEEKQELANTNNTEETLLEAVKLSDVTINNNGSKQELFSRIDVLEQQALAAGV